MDNVLIITEVDNTLDEDLTKSFTIMTKFEYAKLVGELIKLISNSSDPKYKVDYRNGDTVDKMAMRMISSRDIPFSVARVYPDGQIHVLDIKNVCISDH